jgi:hypothetical protein
MRFLPVLFQRTKDDPVPYFPDDFRSYLEDFDDCSSEHLDLFCEDDCQPPICSDFDTSENIVCLRKSLMTFHSNHLLLLYHAFPLKVCLGSIFLMLSFL